MIYDEPRFTPGGDRFIEMELGDELNFDLNFLVHALTARVREADFDGIIELLPNMASIVISYEPDRIGYDDIVREIGEVFASLGSLEDVELPSPLYNLPRALFRPRHPCLLGGLLRPHRRKGVRPRPHGAAQ